MGYLEYMQFALFFMQCCVSIFVCVSYTMYQTSLFCACLRKFDSFFIFLQLLVRKCVGYLSQQKQLKTSKKKSKTTSTSKYIRPSYPRKKKDKGYKDEREQENKPSLCLATGLLTRMWKDHNSAFVLFITSLLNILSEVLFLFKILAVTNNRRQL